MDFSSGCLYSADKFTSRPGQRHPDAYTPAGMLGRWRCLAFGLGKEVEEAVAILEGQTDQPRGVEFAVAPEGVDDQRRDRVDNSSCSISAPVATAAAHEVRRGSRGELFRDRVVGGVLEDVIGERDLQALTD